MKQRTMLVLAVLVVAGWPAVGLTSSPPAPFLSEYVEGAEGKSRGPFDKAIEILNPTVDTVDLVVGGYVLEIYSDGSVTPTHILWLAGLIDPGDVFVVVHEGASPELAMLADLLVADLWFDGNDAILFRRALPVPEYLDVIGQIGFDPPGGAWGFDEWSTRDRVLRRSGDIIFGDSEPFDLFDIIQMILDGEWASFPPDDYSGLGLGGFASALVFEDGFESGDTSAW